MTKIQLQSLFHENFMFANPHETGSEDVLHFYSKFKAEFTEYFNSVYESEATDEELDAAYYATILKQAIHHDKTNFFWGSEVEVTTEELLEGKESLALNIFSCRGFVDYEKTNNTVYYIYTVLTAELCQKTLSLLKEYSEEDITTIKEVEEELEERIKSELKGEDKKFISTLIKNRISFLPPPEFDLVFLVDSLYNKHRLDFITEYKKTVTIEDLTTINELANKIWSSIDHLCYPDTIDLVISLPCIFELVINHYDFIKGLEMFNQGLEQRISYQQWEEFIKNSDNYKEMPISWWKELV